MNNKKYSKDFDILRFTFIIQHKQYNVLSHHYKNKFQKQIPVFNLFLGLVAV